MTKQRKNPIRVGLLMDAWFHRAWAFKMLEIIRASEYADIVLVVLNQGKAKRKGFLRRIWDNRTRFFHGVYEHFENLVCKPLPNALELKDSRELLKDIPVEKVMPKQVGPCDSLNETDAERIQAYDLDVAICMGFRQIHGNFLNCAKYGVWLFRHSDTRILRGEPAGFWEVFEHHSTIGTTLQILKEDMDNEQSLARSWSATKQFSVKNTLNKCYWKATSIIPRKLKDLQDMGETEFFKRIQHLNPTPAFYDNRLYTIPGNLEFIRVFCQHAAWSLKSMFHNLIFREEWMLLYKLGDGLTTAFHRFNRKITPPRGKLYADPHVAQKNDRYYVFFEVSPCAEERGYIAVITIDNEGNHTEPAKVLERPYHLAYPSIIEWEGSYYMIPDSGANRTVEAYRCENFPGKWSLHKTLMKDINAVDPTIFQYGRKWWMFLSVQEHKGTSYSDEVFLYYADNPLSDKWTPHPGNPIVSDARKARPAGKVLEHSGKLYRLSQNCTRGYGYGINLHEIVTISETEYKEKDAQSLEPLWDAKITGMHTLAHAGNLTVIDVRERKSRWFQ